MRIWQGIWKRRTNDDKLDKLKTASEPLICPRCGEKAFFHWCPNFKDDRSK
jgi:hypothetical protein